MEGLRSFIKEDIHRAVDVGRLRKGIRPFKVQKPNVSEDYPEAAIREGAVELTMRADEVRTLKACINIDHIEDDRWGRRWLMRTGMLSANQIYKGTRGEKWEELYCHYREVSRATGATKPSESQKAKALWAMKAAKDRGEEFYDPAGREYHYGKETDTTGAVGRPPQRPNHSLGQKLLENPY